MAAFTGPTIVKKAGGLGRRNPSTDGIFGLILAGVATGSLAVGDILKCIQLKDAEDAGLTASYDANYGILVHHHISEYFKYHPDGTLYVMLVPQGTSMTQMVDKNNQYLSKLLLDSSTNREIKYAGVVLNPDLGGYSPYTPTYTDGLDSDLITAIPKAQELVDDLIANEQYYLDGVMLEGRMDTDPAVTISSLRDLRAFAAENVSVVIAQDPVIAALDNDYAQYAAVGAALGMLSIRKVSEDIGSVNIAHKPSGKESDANYPLTDTANSRWLTAAISKGTAYTALTPAERTALDTKGYVFAGFYNNYPNIYFNDSPTCVQAASDFGWIENNRTWAKAARLLRQALVPRIKSEVFVDPDTGYISPPTIAEWEAIGQQAVGQMAADQEISGQPTVFIDPNQNVLSGSPVVVKVTIVPVGIARAITVEVGFDNPLV